MSISQQVIDIKNSITNNTSGLLWGIAQGFVAADDLARIWRIRHHVCAHVGALRDLFGANARFFHGCFADVSLCAACVARRTPVLVGEAHVRSLSTNSDWHSAVEVWNALVALQRACRYRL